MTVPATSLLAWAKTQEKLSAKQVCIWNMLKDCKFPVTNGELSRLLGWEINCVTPRVKELRDHGLVVNDGRRNCHKTGNPALTWKAYEGARQ